MPPAAKTRRASAVLLCKHDLVRTAPTDAVDEVDLAVQTPPAHHSTGPSSARRPRGTRGDCPSGEKNGLEAPSLRGIAVASSWSRRRTTLDATLTFSAEDDDGHPEKTPSPCGSADPGPTMCPLEFAQQAFSRPHTNQHARDRKSSRLGAHRHPHDEPREGGYRCCADDHARIYSPPARTAGFNRAGFDNG